MPEHVLMSEIEIITDGGRRRRWSAAEKLRIVEETLDGQASVSAVASTLSSSGKPAVVTAGAAANDPVWRWKMAAGFASLAAVGVMVWNLLGQQPAAGGADALMAAHGSSAAVPAATVMQQEEGVLKAQEQQAQGLAASAEDPYTEALLLAHTQLGESLLLQDALLTE